MALELTFESEEWDAVCDWLRSRENRLMYALRSRSREWERVYRLRRDVESQLDGDEAGGAGRRVTLSESQVSYLRSHLRRREFVLRFLPWREGERREVRRVRRHLRAQARTVADGDAGDRVAVA